MKVELIQATKNAGKLIADIASICYGKDEAGDPQRLLEHLYERGHFSVYEHAYYTFKIEGVSRVLLAQLTRHRLASPTVRSQRYCDESNIHNIIPPTIAINEKAREVFGFGCKTSEYVYRELIELGIPREDARYATLQAGETKLYFSCNFREVLHISELRTAKSAQWEIRELANKIIKLILGETPELEIVFEAMRKIKRINTDRLAEIHNLICKILDGKIEYLQEARKAKEELEKVLGY